MPGNGWKNNEGDKINDKMLKAAQELCYLGEMLSVGGGCMLAVITRYQCSSEVLPIATTSHQPQSSCSEQRLDVCNMREKCDAACKALGNDSGYTEP